MLKKFDHYFFLLLTKFYTSANSYKLKAKDIVPGMTYIIPTVVMRLLLSKYNLYNSHLK